MKVILLKNVRGVGQPGAVKEVAEGYARNFLLPQKLAEAATPERVAEIEKNVAARAAAREHEEEQLAAKINALRGKVVHLASRATEKGGLFKSITAADIAKAIHAEHSLEIPEEAIVVSEPIKTVGEHVVHVQHKSTKADLGVVVAAAI